MTTVDNFVPDISPYDLVEDLEELFDEFVDEDYIFDLFANSSNVEVRVCMCVYLHLCE